jgi:hypothetical protein
MQQQQPRGLSGALFEGLLMPTEREAVATTSASLSSLAEGLRLFGRGLESIEGAEAGAGLFLRQGDAVDRAADDLRRHGAAANERAAAAARFLQPQLQEGLGVINILDGGRVCAAELHAALLRERETLRTYRGNVLPPQAVSDGYSRMGDLLSFMAGQEDIMTCIAAHQTIAGGYAMAAAPAPHLHYRHHRPRQGRCSCTFASFWSA